MNQKLREHVKRVSDLLRKDGVWRGVDSIAANTNLSRSNAQDALDILTEDGSINCMVDKGRIIYGVGKNVWKELPSQVYQLLNDGTARSPIDIARQLSAPIDEIERALSELHEENKVRFAEINDELVYAVKQNEKQTKTATKTATKTEGNIMEKETVETVTAQENIVVGIFSDGSIQLKLNNGSTNLNLDYHQSQKLWEMMMRYQGIAS